MTGIAESFVLYLDHAGHAAPLSRCFHATASRRLSSLSEKYPSTTTTEVDSAFCPQCFYFQDAASAASNPFCNACQQCPLCQSLASIVVDENQAFFKCGYCTWTSKDCQLIVTVPDTDSVALGKAKEDLMSLLQTKKMLLDSEASTHYTYMLKALDTIAKDELKRKKTFIHNKSNTTTRNGPWSVAALEASIQTRQSKPPYSTHAGEKPLKPLAAEQSLDESLATSTPTTLLLQPVVSMPDLLPHAMPLRPRLSRRCRAELKQGRPGILVKPKLNPLEGDSSLRSGHGQWWKKDASAIQVVPRISIIKICDNNCMLVKVTNPTLGVVKLCLGPPTTTISSDTDEWTNVVVDSLSGLTMDIIIDKTPVLCETTDMVTLESVEDSFLDMTKSQVPDAVKSFTSGGMTRVVATQADTAWFEVSGGSGGAVPISLQIQVGDGSWESSMIKKQANSDGLDLCIFDVVLVPPIHKSIT